MNAHADVSVVNHGSVFQFYLQSQAAREWWDDHVPDEGFQWSSTVKVVEARYAEDLAGGMQADGLQLE